MIPATSILFKINGQNVIVDCYDNPDIDEDAYYNSYFYFKRSYWKEKYLSREKLKPYGLSYDVYPSSIFLNTMKRFVHQSPHGVVNKTKSLIRSIDTANKLSYLSRVNCFSYEPMDVDNSDLSVIFYARLWDPEWDEDHSLNEQQQHDRVNINEL